MIPYADYMIDTHFLENMNEVFSLALSWPQFFGRLTQFLSPRIGRLQSADVTGRWMRFWIPLRITAIESGYLGAAIRHFFILPKCALGT